MSHRFAPRAARLQRSSAALVFALLSFLCAYQTMGLLHAVAHGNGYSNTQTHSVVALSHGQHNDHDSHDSHDALERLFSGHEQDDSDCRLFDQSTHSEAMANLPLLVLPLALAPLLFSLLPGLALARWHALAQARGPPLIR